MNLPEGEDITNLEPLTNLAEEMGIQLSRMQRWAASDRKNNFPEPITQIGNTNFYRRNEVETWVALFSKTKRAKTDPLKNKRSGDGTGD